MPKIPLSYKQHRHIIGNHTNWLDRKQKSQKYQDNHIKCLARMPGRHTDNLHRQNMALAAIQLFSLLSSVRNCRTYPAITRQRAHGLYINSRVQETDLYFRLNTQELFRPQDIKEESWMHKRDVALNMGVKPVMDPIINIVTGTLHSIKNVISESDQFIVRFDPLKFPSAQGFPENRENFLVKFDIDDNANDFERSYNDVIKGKGYDFIESARNSLSLYVNNYNSKYPGLKLLACSVLKEKIQERFQLDIDPDTVRFVHFNNIMYDSKGRSHSPDTFENKTLTEWLFTNFNAGIRNNMQDMDAACGIYNMSVWSTKKIFRDSDELNIKPTDFIQLVYDIDFYNYARDKLIESFKDIDAHIKKYFIDFMNHLHISGINKESAKDVLGGIGLLEDRNVDVFLFDINQYKAANAFVFRNNVGSITLYFPQSDFKFISFRSNVEMQSWVTNACSTKEHREMIASHFTISTRQDGLLYYGVDAWLNFIHQNNKYSYVIAMIRDVIPVKHFFEFLLIGMKDKAFSDLDSLIKSDAEIRRDMWEEMIDASNIFANPISPFLSLGMHLQHAIEADTYEEKQQEWNKIKYDSVNMVTMMVLTSAIKFPELEGYDFIDTVNKEIKTADLEEMENAIEMNIFPDRGVDPDLSPQSKLSDEQIEYNILQYSQYSKKFWPVYEVKLNPNLEEVENIIRLFLEEVLEGYPYDIFYGFTEKVELPKYIRKMRSNVKIYLKFVKNYIDKADHCLTHSDYEGEIKQYLSQALDTQDEHIITEAIARLRLQVERSKKFFIESEAKQFGNFGIVSTKQIAKPKKPSVFKSAIKDLNTLREMVPAFSIKQDPLRRIFLINDAFPDAAFNNILDSSILHEVSHLAAGTMDYYYNSIGRNTFLQGNKMDLLQEFNKALAEGHLDDRDDFEYFMKSIYKDLDINQEFNENIAWRILRRDPMMKANMMLDNADNFVVYIQDIANLNNDVR